MRKIELPKRPRRLNAFSTLFTSVLAAAASPAALAQTDASAPQKGLYPAVGVHLYRPERADQFPWSRLEDTVPGDAASREIWARNLAYDARIFGTTPVLIYRQMYDQAIGLTGPNYVGFNRFAHGRKLAEPGYRAFKSPNADTLYSNVYLDLRDGPILFEVPDTAGRYYTANLLDMYGNATSIGARTHGTKAGRFLIATEDWQGEAPANAQVFRVASPFMWILLRVLVTDAADMVRANALQDKFTLTPQVPGKPGRAYPDGRDTSTAGFLRILDFMLRENGVPEREQALVYRFRNIGVAGPRALDQALADEPTRKGLEQGFREAGQVIETSVIQNGRRVGSWSEPLDVGRYGYNYLYRSALNTLGTGANVTEENYPFSSFEDESGQRLDGSKGVYELRLAPPPPARFFWSVTVYDAVTRELHPNRARKYLVNDRTPGLVRNKDGSVTIRFEADSVGGKSDNGKGAKGAGRVNLLPVPSGPFSVAIRAQGPMEPILNRSWRPPAIRKVAEAVPAGK